MGTFMKYIVFRHDGNENEELIYLFPQRESHKLFVQRACPEGWTAVRGGMVMLESGKLSCLGEAFSLGLFGDRRKDTDLLRSQIEQA